MIHEIFPVGPLQCNCSVLGDETSQEAMVVDPGADIDQLLAVIAQRGLKVKQIVVTHGHIDHIGGAMKLKAATGAPILMHKADLEQLPFLDQFAEFVGMEPPGPVSIDAGLRDAATLTLPNISATVMHTPGHTQGSVCLYLPAAQKLIAGDLLFAGSIGRTDLPGGNYHKIMQSLRNVVTLPEQTIVVPGHGPLTSIGTERESNPFLVQ
jgi:glyoxylase-like metal-dependent hydrolase (beta-lactamase superfamily II)